MMVDDDNIINSQINNRRAYELASNLIRSVPEVFQKFAPTVRVLMMVRCY